LLTRFTTSNEINWFDFDLCSSNFSGRESNMAFLNSTDLRREDETCGYGGCSHFIPWPTAQILHSQWLAKDLEFIASVLRDNFWDIWLTSIVTSLLCPVLSSTVLRALCRVIPRLQLLFTPNRIIQSIPLQEHTGNRV
jgi:hypothetical protein